MRSWACWFKLALLVQVSLETSSCLAVEGPPRNRGVTQQRRWTPQVQETKRHQRNCTGSSLSSADLAEEENISSRPPTHPINEPESLHGPRPWVPTTRTTMEPHPGATAPQGDCASAPGREILVPPWRSEPRADTRPHQESSSNKEGPEGKIFHGPWAMQNIDSVFLRRPQESP